MIKQLLIIIPIIFFSYKAFSSDKDTTDQLLQLDLLEPRQAAWKGLVIDKGFIHLHNAPTLYQTKLLRPANINIYYYHRIEVGSERLTLNPGIGIGFDNFYFQGNIRLNTRGDEVLINEENIPGHSYKTSKLNTNYLDIPLELRFRSSTINRRAFKIGLGAKLGVLFDSKTKVKFHDGARTIRVKEKQDHHVNRFRYGVIGRIGYGRILFYAYYGLNDLFRRDTAPEMRPLMFGLTLSYF